MNYTNREVVRRLKQYDMFLNSLNLSADSLQKERICDQLDKIEKQILLETNVEYEDAYLHLLARETSFLSEEKEKHKEVTGSLVELTTFLGEDKLSVFRKKLKIIEKYEENKIRQEKLIKEMKVLDVKISEASRNVKANTRLNDSLENKMISTVGKALDTLGLYALVDKKEQIEKKYESLDYALNMASENLKMAKDLDNGEMIYECEEILSEVTVEHKEYKEKVYTIKLIEIYEKPVSNYDELLSKREEMDDILKNIEDSPLYNLISAELNKQYNTIKLEKHDIDNYDSLKVMRDEKNKELYNIEEENNSKEFKEVLDELIKKENRRYEEELKKARKEEYEERQKRLVEEQKLEESRVRRQKLLEQARLKEQQERLEKVKELQEKTVINPKREELVEINNPLKNKTFEEIFGFSSNPNASNAPEDSIIPSVYKEKEETLFQNIEEPQMYEEEDSSSGSNDIAMPIINDFDIKNNEADLFKEDKEVTNLVFENYTSKQEDIKSVYDLTENNKDLIWNDKKNNIYEDGIPVIESRNLKPELLENPQKDDKLFPEIGKKEGEMLWKETL